MHFSRGHLVSSPPVRTLWIRHWGFSHFRHSFWWRIIQNWDRWLFWKIALFLRITSWWARCARWGWSSRVKEVRGRYATWWVVVTAMPESTTCTPTPQDKNQNPNDTTCHNASNSNPRKRYTRTQAIWSRRRARTRGYGRLFRGRVWVGGLSNCSIWWHSGYSISTV